MGHLSSLACTQLNTLAALPTCHWVPAGCGDTVDVGEASYSMVLADDLDVNGLMELVVTTMNGNVYCFETQASYDPLLTWPSQVWPAPQQHLCFLRQAAS